jgi:hypothetical protein
VTVTFNLPAEEYQALEALAAQRSVPVTQVIRQAIATERFLADQLDQGARILVETSDGKVREVVFGQPDRTRRAGLRSRG